MSNFTKFFILLAIGLVLAISSIALIGGKKREYDIVVMLKARPYQLFSYLTEPEQKKRWMTGFAEEKLVPNPNDKSDTPDELKEESLLETVIEIDGGPVEFTGQVIRFSENEEVTVKYRSSQMERTTVLRLREKGESTQFEYRRIVRLSGVKGFMSVFSDDTNQDEIEEEVKRLQEIIEKEVDNSLPDPRKVSPTVGVESDGADEPGGGSEQPLSPKADANLDPEDGTDNSSQ